MDREQKEKFIDEVAEMSELINTIPNLDGMAKGFIMLALVQEIFSDVKAKAAKAKFSGIVTGPVSVTPPHCPFMEKLTYDRQSDIWSAKCSVSGRSCEVATYGLRTYPDCLNYRAFKVSEAEKNNVPSGWR